MDLSEVRKVGDAVVLAFPESRSDESRKIFHEMLKAVASNDEYKRVIVDLSKISWFSSLDLGGLVYASREAQSHGAVFVIAGAGPRIQDIFSATRMDTVFAMHPSVDEALAAK